VPTVTIFGEVEDAVLPDEPQPARINAPTHASAAQRRNTNGARREPLGAMRLRITDMSAPPGGGLQELRSTSSDRDERDPPRPLTQHGRSPNLVSRLPADQNDPNGDDRRVLSHSGVPCNGARMASGTPVPTHIGDVSVFPVRDGMMYWPVEKGFVPPPGVDWSQHTEFLTDDGRLPLELGAYLLRARERIVLVDAGGGPDLGLPSSGELLEHLAVLGVSPAEVTDVVFTHLHADHIGWASRDGAPVFAGATYRCDAADWAHFVDRDERVTCRLEPVRDRFELWDADTAILPGVEVLRAPGHTPGSTVVVVSSRDQRLLLLGDVVHCPAELLDEEWLVLGDVDPELAQRTRDALARELEGTGALAGAAHFPGLHLGRVVLAAGRRSWALT
jgi:glyoxylase-like metal-dependent hydrolase (beta-lactamase superfamily II)